MAKVRGAIFTLCSLVVFAFPGFAQKTGTVEFFAAGFSAPEGPALDKKGNLIVVNLLKNYINKITPDGKVSVFMDVGGVCNGSMFDSKGNLYVACTGRRAVLKIDPKMNLSVVTSMSDGDSLLGPNDFAWGKDGRLYFTDPWTSSKDKPIGGVHYIEKNGVTHRFAGGLGFPNGLVFDLDRTHLYVVETGLCHILRYEVNPDGSAGKKEVFFNMGENNSADGIKLDVKGNVWIASYSTGELWCVSPQGKKIDSIKVPGNEPTNLIFGGKDMRTAYVTVNVDYKNDCVYKVRMPYAGVPVPPK
ncbi:MAG: SMP-30/gluconolactonase/LRE family protein [Candidatus Latescibacterota bacterium]